MAVRQSDTAEILHDGQWHPICGHIFWDNDFGADLFCKILGYQFGIIRPESNSESRQVPLPKDGIRIGECNEEDTNLKHCTERDNDLSFPSNCKQEEMAGIKIDCFMEGMKIISNHVIIGLFFVFSPENWF